MEGEFIMLVCWEHDKSSPSVLTVRCDRYSSKPRVNVAKRCLF